MPVKLPRADDLGQIPSARSGRPIASVDQTAYGKGTAAIGQGVLQLGDAFARIAAQKDAADEYETERRFQEFKWNEERQLEESQRQVQPGQADRFADDWTAGYKQRADEFARTIPQNVRGKYDNKLFGLEREGFRSAAGFARGEQKRYSIASLDEHKDRLATTGDLRKSVQDYDTLLEKNPYLTPIEKDEIRRKHLKDMKTRHIDWALMGGQDPEQILKDHGYIPGGKMPKEEAPARPDADLGGVSAKYESGGRGVGFVSSGQGDPGGPSYGVHQLSSKDSMGAFLRSEEGKAYADRFGGARPGTPSFNRVYAEVAAEDPQGFAKAQKDFYTRTHYKPALEAAKRAGFDVDDRGVQEAIFSIGVQHGGAQKIINAASSKGSVQEQIRALYGERSRYVAGLSDLPPDTKASVLNRYRSEVNDALALSGQKSRKDEATLRPLSGAPDDETGGDGPDADDGTGVISYGPGPQPAEGTTLPKYGDMPLTHSDVHKLRTALSHKYQQKIASDIARIQEGGEEEKDENGKTWFEKARPILTQNVLAQWKTKRDAAILTREATAPLMNMSEEQAVAHMQRVGRDENGEDRKDVEFATIRDARRAADSTWGKIVEWRRKDPAAALAEHPIVTRARNDLNGPGGVGIATQEVGEEDPSLPGIVVEGKTPAQIQMARRQLIDATLEAQERVGIPKFLQRTITKEQAQKLINLPDPDTLSDKEVRTGLATAAQNIASIYGPELGERVFKDALALGYKHGGRDQMKDFARYGIRAIGESAASEERFNLLAKQAFGRSITSQDMGRLQMLERLDAMPSVLPEPGTGMDQGRPYIGQPYQSPVQPARQPNERQAQLLLQNIAGNPAKAQKIREDFDLKFGDGAASRVINRLMNGEGDPR